MCIYAVCCDRGPGFYLSAGWKFILVFFKQVVCMRMHMVVYAVRGYVCVLCLSREEESFYADKLPVEYSESTVDPEASHGPRGRDSGRERGRVEKQCDRG